MEMPSDTSNAQADFVNVINEMTASVKAAHAVIRAILERSEADPETLQVKDGISLLALKNHVLMSYLQSLVLLSSHRILGHTLLDRTPPSDSFASTSRGARGGAAGDLVDSLVEGRTVLEKAATLESKMRYQIDKFVRMVKDAPTGDNNDAAVDPLAFRPNPDNLLETRNKVDATPGEYEDADDVEDGIYRPPKIAPVRYDEDRQGRKRREGPLPTALAGLVNYDPSNPYVESASGLGNDPSVKTKRQKELADMTRFEEDNMTRLVMKKSEARRRERDEQDIAYGGTGNTGRFGHAGDFEGEFADVLRSIDRSRGSKLGDGYDSLRTKGKKASVLERSKGRIRGREELDFGDDGEDTRWKKKGRFEADVKRLKKGGRGRGRGRR